MEGKTRTVFPKRVAGLVSAGHRSAESENSGGSAGHMRHAEYLRYGREKTKHEVGLAGVLLRNEREMRTVGKTYIGVLEWR